MYLLVVSEMWGVSDTGVINSPGVKIGECMVWNFCRYAVVGCLVDWQYCERLAYQFGMFKCLMIF